MEQVTADCHALLRKYIFRGDNYLNDLRDNGINGNNRIYDNNIPNMITVPELQKVLFIGRDTAYNLVRRKDFPSVKLGKEYKIFLDKLPDWLYKQQKNK